MSNITAHMVRIQNFYVAGDGSKLPGAQPNFDQASLDMFMRTGKYLYVETWYKVATIVGKTRRAIESAAIDYATQTGIGLDFHLIILKNERGN